MIRYPDNWIRRLSLLPVLLLPIVACKQDESPPPSAPKPAASPPSSKDTSSPASAPRPTEQSSEPSSGSPAAKPSNGGNESAENKGSSTPPPSLGSGNALTFDGLRLKIPSEWVADTVTPSPMGPKAAYRMPKVDGDTQDASMRISHFPAMKGKDDANIDRWLSQVRRADGQPATKTDAKITVSQVGNVRVTLFDISGMITGSMDGSGAGGTANQRMINAILDHPTGPHFLRATGPIATMARWKDSIESCAMSATLIP